jgi:glycosyltransferase involved in cell wall biosynthesis
MGQTLPVSAIVASHNEAPLLERCLPSIGFCDEIIVIDIESSDDTAGVAAAHGARVLWHPWVPIAERARVKFIGEARHEWLLFLDPDEEVPPPLALELSELLPAVEADVGMIHCPYRYYFRGEPLRGTVWGGIKRKAALLRRDGVALRPTVHTGTRLRAGYRAQAIRFKGDNAIAHYWAPSYRVLLEKHRRYLRIEGADRRQQGLVTGFRDIALTPWRAFRESFFEKGGFRDGATGFWLSLLWGAYSTAAKVALLRELRAKGAP